MHSKIAMHGFVETPQLGKMKIGREGLGQAASSKPVIVGDWLSKCKQ